MMHRLRMTTTMFGAVLLLYVLCMEANLELTKRFLKSAEKKTQNEDQRKERWQEHWADVFQCSIIEFHRYRPAQGGSHEHCPDLDLSPEAMEVSIARCRRHNATGRDLLSNEVMQAGGRPMAELASELTIKIADTERWPKEFQGGRVTELFKKGSPQNCDDYRRILPASHLAKLVLHQFLKPIKPVFDARNTSCSNGCSEQAWH